MEAMLTPGGHYSQKELVLPLKLQPLVSHSPEKSPFLPAGSLHLLLQGMADPSQATTPRLCRLEAHLTDLGQLPLFIYHSITGWHPK